jgi:hypothetical protein
MRATSLDAGATQPSTHEAACAVPHALAADARVSALFDALYADLCRLARREVRRNGA